MTLYRLTRDKARCVKCGNCILYLPNLLTNGKFYVTEIVFDAQIMEEWGNSINTALNKCFLDSLKLEGPF